MKQTLRHLDVREARELLRSLDGALMEPPAVTSVEFPEGMDWRFRKLEGVQLRDVNCGGPKIFGSLFRRPLIKGCSFQHVTLDGLAIWRADFLDCTFEAASLGRRYLGLFKKCSFVGCSFIDCQIEGIGFVQTSFTRCHLDASRFSDVRWERCALDGVDASGSMASTGFVACELRQVDFSAVAFSNCSLLDNTVVDLKLPDNPGNFMLPPRLLLEAQNRLQERLSADGFAQYAVLARILSQSRSDLLVDESLFQRVPQAERRVVMSMLFELSHRGT